MRVDSSLLLALGLCTSVFSLAAEEPLSLTDALRSAGTRNPRLAAIAESREASRSRAEQARLDQYGRLDLSLQWAPSTKNQSITVQGFSPSVPNQTFDLKLQQKHQFSISFDQPLWTWGSLSGRARAAQAQVQAEDAAVVREAQMLRFDVTRAYLQAQQAEAMVAVAVEAVRQEQAFLDTAKARSRAGQSPRLDVLKAELGLSTAESNLVTRRNAAKTAREELVTVTEDPRFRNGSLGPNSESLDFVGNEDDLVAEAQRQRADLKVLERGGHALSLEADAQRAAGKPSLSLVGSLSQQKDSLNGMLQADQRTYLLGVAVRWDALGVRRANARGAERQAQAQQRRSQAQELTSRIALEVRNAKFLMEEATSQARLAASALQQAEEQARVARLAYREGVTTAVEAQDAELALTRARTQVLTAGMEMNMAQARLRLALGRD